MELNTSELRFQFTQNRAAAITVIDINFQELINIFLSF